MTMKQQGLMHSNLGEETEQSGPKIIVKRRNPQGSVITLPHTIIDINKFLKEHPQTRSGIISKVAIMSQFKLL